MKAILKSNGKEVDVELYSPTRYIETKASDSYGKTIFDADALIVTGAPIDWQAFRREAAKDILAGLVVQKNWRYHPDEYDKDEEEAQKRAAKRAAYTAIVYADELIKQLKED